MNTYDLVIVGAGPSGIFAAYELKKHNRDARILMIEKGRSIEKRNLYALGDGAGLTRGLMQASMNGVCLGRMLADVWQLKV